SVGGTRLRVEIEREKFRDEDDENHGRVAEPEPEDRQRDPRDARNWIERSDDGIYEFTNGTDTANDESQRDGKRGGQRKAGDGTGEARHQVLVDVRPVEPALVVVQRQCVDDSARD